MKYIHFKIIVTKITNQPRQRLNKTTGSRIKIMKTFEFYRNGTVHGEVQAINLRAAKKEVFATFGRELQVCEREEENILKDAFTELKAAKKSKISSWIEAATIQINLIQDFFKLADKLGLVVNGMYVGGIPKGTDEDINNFYAIEDKLDYPSPQMI